MEHWFDAFVKGLARGGVSRRDLLKLAVQGAAAATVGSVIPVRAMSRSISGKPPLPPPTSEQRGACTISQEGPTTTLKYGVQSSVNGKQLIHECEITITSGSTPRDAKAARITSSTTVKLGNDPLLQIDRNSQGGSTQVKYSYGPAFQGIKEVAFTTDGKILEGTVDNRSIVPHPAGADPSTIKYADGGASPAVKIDSEIGNALSALLKQAHDTVSTCKNAGGSRSSNDADGWFQPLTGRRRASSLRSRSAEIASLSPAVFAFAPSAFGALEPVAFPEGAGEGFGMGQVGGSGCTSCQNDCIATYGECEAGVGGGCLVAWLCPPCGAACDGIGTVTCAATAGGECLSNCSNPGSACCPIGCSNGSCCNSGQQCTPNGSCCPDGVEICGNTCCSRGQVCKDGVCCTADHNVCKGVCCPAGNVCSTEDICCPQLKNGEKPISCDGACCPEGQNCAKSYPNSKNDVCCYTEHICGGVCCPDGCVNGKCAPLCLVGVNCGTSCCDWGCADAATNTCKPAQKCAKGESVCTGNAAGVANVCCPTGTGCLNGKCCPTGTVPCNNKTTGVSGCWPQSQCYVPPPPK